MQGDYTIYLLIGVVFGGISMIVSSRLKSKFKKYSKVYLQNGLSGKEIAEKMLADHQIYDVKVISTPGQLTDHYNPANKTVNLSDVVYNERNAAAAAVAAHEVGHAVQHATAYSWLQMRSKMVPMVSISSRFVSIALMVGIGLMATGVDIVMQIAVGMLAVTTLFSLVTLPVEYDASKRALQWLEGKHMVTRKEYAGAKDALKWAARTYLVAAIGAVATLLYWVSVMMRNR